MPKLGLGNVASSATSMITPGIVTDSLVMKHMYPAGAVQPLSDGAAYFTTSDHISISSLTLDTDGNCSVIFWAKRTEVSSEDAILGNTAGAGNKILRFNSNTTMALESEASDEATITLNSPNDYDWHHYAIVCTSGTVTAFQDGVSCSVSNPAMATNTVFDLIGAAGADGDSRNYEGYLCNLGIWSDALTQPEIKSIMWKGYTDLTTGTDSESDDLVSWWALDVDGSDSTETNDGTLTD